MCVNEIFHRGGNARSRTHTRSLAWSGRKKQTNGKNGNDKKKALLFFSLLSPPDAGVKGKRKREKKIL